MINNAISNVIYFGIGCFHFGVKKSPPFTLQGSDYLKELQGQLESMPNINNIIIDDPLGLVVNHSADVEEPLTSMAEGYAFFPPADGPSLRIQFDLYIPHRLQKQLSPSGRKLFTSTERFRAYVYHPFHFPVTIIEAIEPTEGCEPSDGVVIVREFLKKHFEESKSEYIRFDCLGPSPFHANFSLQPGVASEQEFDNSGFRCEPLHQRGYDRIEFFFDPSVYLDINEAKDHLFDELEAEAAVFYRITHVNLMRMHKWEYLQHLIRGLIKTYKTRGLRALWNRVLKAYKQIQEIAIAVAEFESHELWTDYDMENIYRELTSEDRKQPFIDSYLRAAMQNRAVYKCSQIRDLIELLETRRSKTMEGIITILAAILGGAIGAVITLLITVW